MVMVDSLIANANDIHDDRSNVNFNDNGNGIEKGVADSSDKSKGNDKMRMKLLVIVRMRRNTVEVRYTDLGKIYNNS